MWLWRKWEQTWNTLYGSFSWTSSAAALIRCCFRADANASSSTSPPRAVFTRNAPGRIWRWECQDVSFTNRSVTKVYHHIPVWLWIRWLDGGYARWACNVGKRNRTGTADLVVCTLVWGPATDRYRRANMDRRRWRLDRKLSPAKQPHCLLVRGRPGRVCLRESGRNPVREINDVISNHCSFT